VQHLDDIGGPEQSLELSWGWAQAGNTPFKWYKQNTHEGGVHVPLVVHWPKASARGEVRDQFHYVTDIAPTVFERRASRCRSPTGLEQCDGGVSLAYAFDRPMNRVEDDAVLEMVGRDVHEGWKAVTRHVFGVSFDDDRWELYHVAEDPRSARPGRDNPEKSKS